MMVNVPFSIACGICSVVVFSVVGWLHDGALIVFGLANDVESLAKAVTVRQEPADIFDRRVYPPQTIIATRSSAIPLGKTCQLCRCTSSHRRHLQTRRHDPGNSLPHVCAISKLEGEWFSARSMRGWKF